MSLRGFLIVAGHATASFPSSANSLAGVGKVPVLIQVEIDGPIFRIGGPSISWAEFTGNWLTYREVERSGREITIALVIATRIGEVGNFDLLDKLLTRLGNIVWHDQWLACAARFLIGKAIEVVAAVVTVGEINGNAHLPAGTCPIAVRCR